MVSAAKRVVSAVAVANRKNPQAGNYVESQRLPPTILNKWNAVRNEQRRYAPRELDAMVLGRE